MQNCLRNSRNQVAPITRGLISFLRLLHILNTTLQEAVRVLKPGGTLEIIEEDLIFPFRAPSDDGSHQSGRSTTASFSMNSDHESSGSSGEHSVRTFPAASSRRPLSVMVPRNLNPRTRSRSLGATTNSSNPTTTSYAKGAYNPPATYGFSTQPSEWIAMLPSLTAAEAANLGISLRDPRDHSILYHAWNGMLDQRFISK